MVLDLKEKTENTAGKSAADDDRGLPPVALVLIAAVVLGGILAIYLVGSRKPPTSTGSVISYQAVPIHSVSARSIAPGEMGTLEGTQETSDRILATVNVSITNATEKMMYIKDAQVQVTPPEGDPMTDQGAVGSDYERIFQVYPSLKTGALDPIRVETKIPAGQTLQGTILVGFNMKKEAWDARKSLKAVINLYDHAPLVLDVPASAGTTAEMAPPDTGKPETSKKASAKK